MIAIGTRALWEGKRRAIDVEGTVFYKGEWMESGQNRRLSPIVFLAEHPPNYELLPHFHRENQFQLFVEGEGTIGKQILRPITVHYAGAYTGYGPLVSGPSGLKYFTIRAAYDTGYIPVTRARTEMPRGPKKSATSPAVALTTSRELASLQYPSEEILIPATHEGMGAFLTRLPPSTAYAVRHLQESLGLFIFVLTGSLERAGMALGKWESLFLANGEKPQLRAGAEGAEFVTLSLPPKSREYREEQRDAAPDLGTIT